MNSPHINIGTFGQKPLAAEMVASGLGSLVETPSPHHFSTLTEEARDLILRATMGEFDNSPPEISDKLKAEIIQWAMEPDVGDVGDVGDGGDCCIEACGCHD